MHSDVNSSNDITVHMYNHVRLNSNVVHQEYAMDKILTPTLATIIILSLVIALVCAIYFGLKWYTRYWKLAVKVKGMAEKAEEQYPEFVAVKRKTDGQIFYAQIMRRGEIQGNRGMTDG